MNTTEPSLAPLHPISEVARRTGLSIHVLRAWERRYGVVTPSRSEGGRRLYSEMDVARLRLLQKLTREGGSIAALARRPTAELARLAAEADATETVPEAGPGGEARAVVEAALAAAGAMDDRALYRTLSRASTLMAPEVFVEQVAGPLLERTGECWEGGEFSPAHEHMLTVVVRRVLYTLMQQLEPELNAPGVVITTLAGELHELGAMLAAVVAAGEGWRVLYLGPDLPVTDIAQAVRARGATAVVVSMVYVEGEQEVLDELTLLRSHLPRRTALLIGGRAVRGSLRNEAAVHGALPVGDFAALRALLRALRGGSAN